MSIYKIPKFSNVDEFLLNVATVRGKLKKGGVVDSLAAARIVLHDWNEGTSSPDIQTKTSNRMVSTWLQISGLRVILQIEWLILLHHLLGAYIHIVSAKCVVREGLFMEAL